MSMDLLEKKLQDAGLNLDSVSRSQASRAWGFTEDKARHVLAKLRSGSPAVAKASAPIGKPVKTECIEITEKEMKYELPRTRINTLEELIKQFKVDTSKWKVERFICNSWEVGVKISEGILTSPLYQVKATFVKKDGWDTESIKAEIDRIKEDAKREIKPFNINKVSCLGSDGDNILEISIPDAHIGGMSWSAETGQANYDHKIASKLYKEAFEDLLHRGCKTGKIKKLMLVIGNDLMNSDQQEPKTTKGTLVDQDSRWQKMYLAAWNVIKNSVDTAVQVAPVDVCVMPGNHDRLSLYGLGHSLECYYNNAKYVEIDNRPLIRKHYKMGVNMLTITHGDCIKIKDLPMLMAAEAPEIFGSTKFRYAHTGHYHQEKLFEVPGVKVRIIPSLCPANAWAVANGYSSSVRGAQAFTWNLHKGPIAVTEHFIDIMAE